MNRFPGARITACLVLLVAWILLDQPVSGAPQKNSILGPIAGAATAHSARIWVRTAQPASVQIQYSTSSDMTTVQWSKKRKTRQASDLTTTVPLDNLAAATTYYYHVWVDGKRSTARPAQFSTFAECGAPADFSFGVLTDFGSKGAIRFQLPVKSPVFKNLAKETPAPQFVVIGGDFWHNEVEKDQVLADDDYVNAERSRYRAMYSRDSSQGPYDSFVRQILSRFALVHFWDDHDLGYNNASKTYLHKRLALRVLQEYFPVYDTGAFGDWQAFCYGDVDFFVLDARSQRDPQYLPDDTNKSLLDGDNLGAKGQWDWLTTRLLSSTARWKIIFSPVMFNPTSQKHDAWFGYRTEHDRLVNFIREHAISGVVIISGDTHAGAMDDGTNAGLPEMLVPGPNMASSCFTSKTVGSWSHGVYGTLQNLPCRGYGIVRVMTDPDRLLLQVKDAKGALKLEMELD